MGRQEWEKEHGRSSGMLWVSNPRYRRKTLRITSDDVPKSGREASEQADDAEAPSTPGPGALEYFELENSRSRLRLITLDYV